MKLYVIAGEDSGDLHASNLIAALRQHRPELMTRGVGGQKMADQATELVAHVKDINFMGFVEVVQNLGTIRRLFRTVKEDLQQWQPDAVVLVDYPGFNLRMAKFIHGLGIPVYYYISPQVWAWKKGRVKKIRAFVDRMLVILPFEQAFYEAEGVEVSFVGHPLLDVIGEQAFSQTETPTIALLPGSRKQEISRLLPLMLEVVDQFPDFRFVIAGAPSQEVAFYQQFIDQHPVTLRMNETYQVLTEADYAIVASGTATLETALFRVPEVVVYRGSRLSYAIGKRLVQVDYISLVNLIMGKAVVKELLQDEATPENIANALREMMEPTKQVQLQADYQALRHKLGEVGASERAAQEILQQLSMRKETSALT